MTDATHASFFSGVGGLDLGLERAGWRTVSFSEIDPYASTVLAERWPDVPNLGDIAAVSDRLPVDAQQRGRVGERIAEPPGRAEERDGGGDWRSATLWSGGFPCQDLSVAGKRRGMGAGTRSGLAFAFLDLVERYRPPAILFENVPGLLSSHRGRDFYTLLSRLAELGYGWAFRILDARYFGVPQRRRRVFVVAIHARVDPSGQRAAEVLSVGTRCERHLAAGVEAGPGAADRPAERPDIVGTVPAGLGHHGHAGTSSQAVAAGHVIPDVSPTIPARLGKGTGHTQDGFVVATADGIARAVVGANTYDDDVNTFLVAPTLTRSQERLEHPSDQQYVVAGAVTGRPYDDRGYEQGQLIGPSADADRDGTADGLARRLDDRDDVAATLNSGGNSGGFRTEPGEHLILAPTLTAPGPEGGRRDKIPLAVVAPTVRSGGHGDSGIGRDGDEDRLIVGTVREHVRPGSNTDHTVLAPTLRVGAQRVADGGPGDTVPSIPFVKRGREHHDDGETWGDGDVSPTMDSIGHAARTATAISA